MLLGKFAASNAAEILANAEKVYLQHYENIRRLVPPERLLEYKLGSGWDPLCEFLGKEVPREEFPWLNNSGEMVKRIRNLQSRALWQVWVKVSPFIFVGVVAAAVVGLRMR